MPKGRKGKGGPKGGRKRTTSSSSRSKEPGPGPPVDEDLTKLRNELEAVRKERDHLEDRLAYMQAEFENLKKRSLRDVENRVFRAKEGLFLDLLAVLDNLDRALSQTGTNDLESFLKGVNMIGLQFDQTLAGHGLSVIDTKDQGFDPFRHEAVEKVEDPDRPDGLILEEVQKGYALNGNVIRPSKVRVNVHPSRPGEGDQQEDQDSSQVSKEE